MRWLVDGNILVETKSRRYNHKLLFIKFNFLFRDFNFFSSIKYKNKIKMFSLYYTHYDYQVTRPENCLAQVAAPRAVPGSHTPGTNSSHA